MRMRRRSQWRCISCRSNLISDKCGGCASLNFQHAQLIWLSANILHLARVILMKMRSLKVVVFVGGSMLALGAGKSQTFTGEVSDSMCGASHMMEGKKADCARACVQKGSSYALVVGDKVYSLKTTDKATQDKLS